MSAKAWGDIPRAGGAALRLLVCLLLSLLAAPLAAEYRFDRWTTEHGLPNDSVNAVVQTRDGYLWLATNDGLARFDGVRFKVFDRGNTDGRIGSNRLTALAEDGDGTLWAGTYEGLLVRYRDGEFSTFTAEHGLPYGPIYWIEEDARGGLWLVGNQNLTRWQAERGVSYDLTACLPGRQQDPPAQQRRVWWSTDAAGFHLFHGGRVQTYTRQGGLPSLNINQVEPDRRGNVWVGTSDAGLVKLKDGKPTVYPLDRKWWPGELTGGMAYEDRRGDVWLFTNSVLVRLREGWLTPHAAVKTGGGHFYEDREGALWIGTPNGLYRARPTAIQPLIDAARRRDRLDLNDWAYAILEDREGTVWLGRWGGGVGRYRDGRFTHYVTSEDWQARLASLKNLRPADVIYEPGLFSSRVTSLYEDRAGTLWVGTDGGVSRFEGGRFVRYSDQHGLASVWAMYEDRAGDFWFATTSGLTRRRDGEFTVYTTRDGLAHDDVKVIHEDRRGALWLGTHGGLTRYLDGRFTTFAQLGEHQVRAIYEDSDGVLWVGTYGSGLFRFDGAKFTRYTTNEGLFNNGVFQILEDARGRFWVGSNKGISRVSRQELNQFAAGEVRAVTAVPYGKDDGMLNVECNGGRQPAGWEMRDGTLWFPTMSGVAVIDPAAVPINPVAPPVVIEEVLLDRQPQDFRRGVRIEPGQSQFEVRYTGLSFIKPELVRFKYRLAGLHAEWVDAGTRRAADFSYVPPGEYVFEVVAANSDGVWNERGASLRIIVVPPPWRRWWFYALVCAGLAGAVLFAYRLRVGHLRRETEEATRRRIQAQEGERQRIADRLHDSLGQQIINIRNSALQGLQPAAAEQPGGRARARLAEISATASEAFHEVREIIHDLRPHLLEELGLTETLRSMIRRAADSSGIRFNDDLKDADRALPQEAELAFYRVVQECVNNVVRHSGARAASVTLRRDAGWLRLRVADDGCGFTPEAVAHSRERGGGFGLLNLQDLTRLLGGQLEITTAPGEGTVVTVNIPTPDSLERKL